MKTRAISLGRFLLVCATCALGGVWVGIFFWGGGDNYMAPALGAIAAIPTVMAVWKNAPPASMPDGATNRRGQTGESAEHTY